MPTDENKTTRFEYNLDGNLVKLIAENPTTGDQVTEWIYGVTAAQGSKVESKALVYQKKYPDSTEVNDRVFYQYNRQGQVTLMTDQAGTTHGYAFDRFGRILEDDVLSFGTGIDQTVKTITRSYEVRGMLEAVSSIGSGTTVLNQVQLAYNAYAQLEKDYQEHSGAVNTGASLFVAYSYADGSANTVRRTGITYPDGTTTITTAYLGTDADALSRPDALKEGSDTLCSYRYLGAGVFIGVKYDAASDVELTYEDGGTGDAGDKYTGLDRFGRLIETLWKKGTAAQVHSKYGRNRFGGVVWRKDLTAHVQSVTTEDNFYEYDGLYQVKEHQRGELTGTPPSGITNLQQEEDWTYDATGNWDSYTNSDPATFQDRTNTVANEITQITNPGGNINPAYDPVGNMLTMPTAPGTSTGQYALKWDAWNRLVEVKAGSTNIASYRYDGAFRRLTKASNTETRHFYYNRQWRAVEERVAGASIAVGRQYTWGMRDRWDLLRRKRSTTSSLDEVHFCLKAYLDPVAIVGTDGLVKERFAYDAFGNVRFLAPDYSSRSASSFDWEFLFHAEFHDFETTLYNYGYRYYNAGLGRWLSRDPIEYEQGSNLYFYTDNSPTDLIDFLGLADSYHHWFPQFNGSGQERINKLCMGCLYIKIDDYTSNLGVYKKGTLHYIVHNAFDWAYNKAVEVVYELAGKQKSKACQCLWALNGILLLKEIFLSNAEKFLPIHGIDTGLRTFDELHRSMGVKFAAKVAAAAICCGSSSKLIRDRLARALARKTPMPVVPPVRGIPPQAPRVKQPWLKRFPKLRVFSFYYYLQLFHDSIYDGYSPSDYEPPQA